MERDRFLLLVSVETVALLSGLRVRLIEVLTLVIQAVIVLYSDHIITVLLAIPVLPLIIYIQHAQLTVQASIVLLLIVFITLETIQFLLVQTTILTLSPS